MFDDWGFDDVEGVGWFECGREPPDPEPSWFDVLGEVSVPADCMENPNLVLSKISFVDAVLVGAKGALVDGALGANKLGYEEVDALGGPESSGHRLICVGCAPEGLSLFVLP
jgi:hypothetical protein